MLQSKDSQPQTLVFLIHDKGHEAANSQVMAYCKQAGVKHYVLPKFSKVELCQTFNVKRLTCFAIDFRQESVELQKAVETELSNFDMLIAPNTASL